MALKRIFAVTALACGIAAAQGPGGPGMGAGMGLGMGQGPGGPLAPSFDSIKTYLNLTDAQVTSLQQAGQNQAAALKTVFDQIRTKQQSLRDLLDKGGATPAAVGQLVLDIDTLKKQADTSASAFRDQASALLTTDQKTKLTSLQDAAKLQPAIHEAMSLGLLAPPAAGPGGPMHAGMALRQSAPMHTGQAPGAQTFSHSFAGR